MVASKLKAAELMDIKDHLMKFPPMLGTRLVVKAIGWDVDGEKKGLMKIHNELRRGRFPQPCRKVGRELVWTRRSIIDWMQQGATPPTATS